MARVGRLAGAILAETGGDYFLVGNTKRPCDWAAAGFQPPGELDPLARPYVRLVRSGPLDVAAGSWIELALEGEALARTLAARFLIERNGSVSDRLWGLVIEADPSGEPPPAGALIDARWLGALPPQVWQIVRDSVLRCL
jgi:hypothetical protein